MGADWLVQLRGKLAPDIQVTEQSTRQTRTVFGAAVLCVLLVQFVVTNAEFNWALALRLADIFATLPILDTLLPDERMRFAEVLTWASGTIALYLFFPMAVVRWVLREDLQEFGLRRGNIQQPFRLCVAIAFPTAVVIAAASFFPSFADTYPFFVPSNSWLLFILWELVYGFQLLAVEFFYRGFILHGLKGRFGISALWIMLVPYVLIHIPKPWPEALGAMVAGLVLGLISLRSGSVMLTGFLHVIMAWWMDLMALVHRGGLG